MTPNVKFSTAFLLIQQAVIAQLGERQTEDLKVPGSIPGRGSFFNLHSFFFRISWFYDLMSFNLKLN